MASRRHVVSNRNMSSLRRLLSPAALVAVLALVSGCSRGPEAGPIVIQTAAGTAPTDVVVRATGLSGSELRALAAASLDERAWQAIMRVSVSDTDAAPVAGRYFVTGAAVDFHPSFPFDAGRSYSVRFDPGRLPVARPDDVVVSDVRLEAPERSPSTSVAAVYPSADVWPENMLRFYVHFSAPMSRGAGTTYVHLLDEAGAEVPDAILAAYADLWNGDATRLTVFFDPGRVKRGVGPNVALERAIVEGRRYAIAVDQVWPAADGQPLVEAFRREFTAGPAAYDALAAADWGIVAPRAGTRESLAVTFPAPLDRALLDRAIGVRAADGRDLPGSVGVAPGEMSWTFTPEAPWQPGPHELVALTLLEDPAGNKIGRAFEVLTADAPSSAVEAETVEVSFDVR